MKRLISTILLTFCLSPIMAQVLQLDFDKPADDQLKDLSKYKHEVNTYGGLQYIPDRFGIDCRAALFTGNQIVEVIDNDEFDFGEEFTAMAWMVLPDSLDFQWITLVCKGLESDENRNSPAFRVQMTSQTVSVNTSSTKEIDEISQYYPRERWFHFATTFEEGKITLYVDGKRYKYFITDTQLGRNNHSLTIGYDVPGDTEYFIGAMDDFYLLPKALNEMQINRYMNDDRNKNLSSACPNNPQKTPPMIASNDPSGNSDPWNDIEIDDFGDTPANTPVTNPVTPPVDPWSGIEIDELDDVDPADNPDPAKSDPGNPGPGDPGPGDPGPGDPNPGDPGPNKSNTPPNQPRSNKPGATPPGNDPWSGITIDEFDPTPSPEEAESVSNEPANPVNTGTVQPDPTEPVIIDDPVADPTVDDPTPGDEQTSIPEDSNDPVTPPKNTGDDEPTTDEDRAGTPSTLLPPKQPEDQTPVDRPGISKDPEDLPEQDEPATSKPELPPVKRDSIVLNLPTKKGLKGPDLPVVFNPVKIVPVVVDEDPSEDESPAPIPEIDIPTTDTPEEAAEEPEEVFELDSLDIGRKMILDKIEFARHSHHLNDRSKQVLTELAEVLQKNPDFSILLEGHTETDGNYDANMTLSRKRAEACKRYLIKKRKIKPSRIATKHYGPERPVTTKSDVKWKNRRVEVTVF